MFVFTHRNPEMQIDKQHTALVLADMQNEFLEEKTGTYYELIADALKKRNVIANLEELLKTAQELGYYVIHSPHWYYPTDLQWNIPPGAIAHYLVGIGFCGRKDPVDLEGFRGSRADCYEPLKKYLMDGHTCNTSPHTDRKVLVVTGASQGLGEGFVVAYRKRGWRVVGNSRSIKASSDPDYITVPGDAGEPEVARKVVETALDRFGRVDTDTVIADNHAKVVKPIRHLNLDFRGLRVIKCIPERLACNRADLINDNCVQSFWRTH